MKGTMGCRQLLTVQLGGAICLPVLLVGQVAGQSSGFIGGLLAIIVGNLALAGLAVLGARMSVELRQNTCEVAGRFLGASGERLFAACLALSMLAWFAIQLGAMSSAIQQLGLPLPGYLITAGLGLGLSLTAQYGINGVALFSRFAMPIMLAVLSYAAVIGVEGCRDLSDVGSSQPLSLGLILAASIGVVIDMPTFFRHAKTEKDARRASLILFLFAVPILQGIGLLLGVAAPELDVIGALTQESGPALSAVMLLFLTLAGWTTNNANLYSATACLETLAPQSSSRLRSLSQGILGTGLAILGAVEHMEPLLEAVGVLIAAVGGVMVTAYCLQLEGSKGVLGIILGSCVTGFVGLMSGYGVVDGFVAAAAGTLCLKIIKIRKERGSCPVLTSPI